MTDLTILHQELATLRAARAKGVQVLSQGDESVTYKSDAQMAEAIADLEQRIAAASGQQIRRVRFTTGKGV